MKLIYGCVLMIKFLVTGARSPAALEIARNLSHFGYSVILADTLNYPLAKNSYSVERYYRLPSPLRNIKQFQVEIEKIIVTENIDVIVPTCEEVFYIAFIKDALEKKCSVFCPPFNLIKAMHSKLNILSLCDGLDIRLPKTQLLNEYTISELKDFDQIVLKREFCRFGTGVNLNPSLKNIDEWLAKETTPVLLQEKVRGVEHCSYSVARNGIVLAESIYKPIYRVKSSAGIYFEPVINESISLFIREFCLKYRYTGQVGFDVMLDKNEVTLIECNPRTTSGVHFLENNDLGSLFAESNTKKIMNFQQPIPARNDSNKRTPKMVSSAMLLLALPEALIKGDIKRCWQDYLKATDVISKKNDKSHIIYTFLSFFELLNLAIKKRISIREAATFDIEWDGEDIT